MPKSIEIFPEELFKSGKLKFKDIDINTYNKTVEEEKKIFSTDDFKKIYKDMCILREFENIINQIKIEGSYKGVEYNHAGPAHLSMGQESSAVGQAFDLEVDDHIFGSHRSHGEILAKGLSAISKLSDNELTEIMENFLGGITLKAVESNHKGNVKEMAEKFLIYGAYAEIFARETGFNRGLGGSMHCFFTPFGVYPNNAIVGGSGSVAPGAALFKRVNRKKGIVIANIGDASFGCGPVWEGITFSAMDQYRTLWDESLGGGLPIIFNCFNNQYGMGGQTNGETMGYKFLARIGAGVNPEQMHSERVNGYNPLAVIDAIKRKKKILSEGGGPVLLDTVTYRMSGHSPSDASSYRSKEELDRFNKADAIKTFHDKLLNSKLISENELNTIQNSAVSLVFDMFKSSIDFDISPRLSMDSEYIGKIMFSNKKQEKCDNREPEVLHPIAENPRQIQIDKRIRKATDDNGKPISKMKMYSYRDAIFEAMMHRFYIDPTMIAFGEENRDWGGAFAVYRGMTEALPYHRLFNSPISEAAIVGAAVGYALAGGRAVAELMYCDFLGRSGDEVFNQLSKWQSMSGGVLNMPVVLRISVGAKYGAQHSQDWSAFLNHIPGLKVVFPVTPYDAKGMMNSALAGTDPVIFFESQKVYDYGEQFQKDGVPKDYYEIDLSEPSIKRVGTDLTIITFGPLLYTAIQAADEMQKNHGISCEVIDLRTVNPLNYDIIIKSVQKTGKVLLGSESVERGSVMHNISANITQLAFDYLDAPPVVIGSRNWITPAPELEPMFFPQTSWILDAVNSKIIPLKGYKPTTNQTNGELLKRSHEGV